MSYLEALKMWKIFIYAKYCGYVLIFKIIKGNI